MRKCQICKQQEQDWTWQPFGPNETAICFVTPGNHYRGFTAVGCCDACKDRIEAGEAVTFKYCGSSYTVEA